MSHVTELARPGKCARCGFALGRRWVRSKEGLTHEQVMHCDQLSEAFEVADFLLTLTDVNVCRSVRLERVKRNSSAPNDIFENWRWVFTRYGLGREEKTVVMEQDEDEQLGDFLLRISGGLLP